MSLGVGGIVSVGGGVGGAGGSGSGIFTIDPGGNIGPTVAFTGVNGISIAGGSNVVTVDGAALSGLIGTCFTDGFTATTSGRFTHGLGTRNLVVQVVDDSFPPAQLFPDRIIYDTLDVFSVLFNRPQTGRVVAVSCGGTSVAGTDNAGCFSQAFTNTSDITVTHGLDSTAVVIDVQDSNGFIILPDSIQIVDSDNVRIRFNNVRSGLVTIVACASSASGIVSINSDTGPAIELVGVSGINIIANGNGQISISGEGVVGTGGGGGGGGACFTEDFIDQTILTVNHNLGTQNVIVQVQDANRDIIIPDNVRAIDDNNVQVDFNSQRSGHAFVQACVASSGVGKFAQVFTNTTNVVVTHNLGSEDVIVQVRDNGTPAAWFLPDDILFNSVNSITLQFNSNRSGRVTVMG